MYTKYYLLVSYHVLNFVMINKGCLVSQTMPGFLSFVDLGVLFEKKKKITFISKAHRALNLILIQRPRETQKWPIKGGF